MSYAIITGPTAGIGKAISYQLAERGYNLILVARREERLKDISKELQNKFNIKVDYLTEDLTNKDAPQNIFNYVEQNNIDVEVLILNAGYQHHKKFENVSLEDEEDCLRVLGLSVIMQSKLFIKKLINRGGGRIMVVSSVAGFAPPSGEFATLYGPVKTFMNRFVEALNVAYNKHNIYATALCPGFTITEFHSVSGTQDRMDKVPQFMKYSAEHVAKEGIDGMFKNKEIVISGGIYRFLVSGLSYLPKSFIRFIGNKIAGGRYE